MKRIIGPLACLLCALVGAYVGTSLAQDDPCVYPHYPGSAYYADIEAGTAHDEDIGYAREAGIVRGYSNVIYGPAWVVSREQMATFEMRDFTLGLVLALRMSGVLHSYGAYVPSSDLTVEERQRRDSQLLKWTADLIEHEGRSRPDDAIWGPELYTDMATWLRALGVWLET